MNRLEDHTVEGYYEPHIGQQRILQSHSRLRMVIAANRWGKTSVGMREVLWCARGQHPYRQVKPDPRLFFIAIPDFSLVYEAVHRPEFEYWCPRDWMVGEFNETKKRCDISRADGGICQIRFVSYEQNPKSLVGAAVDGIWFDEPPPRPHVKEAMARVVTTKGWILMSMTPVDGAGWWYGAIYQPAKKAQEGGENAPESEWELHQAPLAERDVTNQEDYEVGKSLVPHLEREDIIWFAKKYPDLDDRLIRIFGEVRSKQGLVYKQFNWAVHVIEPFAIPKEFEIWGAIDPGYHGFAVVIGAVNPRDHRMYIVEEIFSQQEPTTVRFQKVADAVRRLRPKISDWETRRPTIVMFVDTEDPQVVMELNIEATKFADQQEREGRPLILKFAFAALDMGLKARKAGFLRVQQMLHPQKWREKPEYIGRDTPTEYDEVIGEPMLYFYDSLYSEWQGDDDYMTQSRVLWEIMEYSWKEPKQDSLLKVDEADEESAQGGHSMDALRYLVMSRMAGMDFDEVPEDELERRLTEKPLEPEQAKDTGSELERIVSADFLEVERLSLEEDGL